MMEYSHKSNYLDLPFCKAQHKGKTFSSIIDKVNNRLNAWKVKVLSFEGRGVLVQSVAQSIPSYTMQTYLISMKICEKVDSRIRDF